MQARFIPALAAVHNFIQIHEPSDRLRDSSSSATGSQVFSENGAANIEDEEAEEDKEELARQWKITPEERRRAGAERDHIAKEMWNNYQEELHRHGM